jgi:hypothetical protein
MISTLNHKEKGRSFSVKRKKSNSVPSSSQNGSQQDDKEIQKDPYQDVMFRKTFMKHRVISKENSSMEKITRGVIMQLHESQKDTQTLLLEQGVRPKLTTGENNSMIQSEIELQDILQASFRNNDKKSGSNSGMGTARVVDH